MNERLRESFSKIAELAPEAFRTKYVSALEQVIHTPQLTKTRLNEITTELEYVSEAKLFVPTLHLGQRKLFLSELRFLVYVLEQMMLKESDLSKFLVVYAGAGPGVHIPYLYTLFPHLRMLLIDPVKFILPLLQDNPFKPVYIENVDDVATWTAKMNAGSTQVNCLIINDFMTHSIAHELRAQKHRIIFISDIRTNDSEDIGAPDIDILWNHYMQMNWIFEMRPEWNMLKFRYPFYNVPLAPESFKDDEFRLAAKHTKGVVDVRKQYALQEFMYFDGVPWLQVYPGRRSREMRLVFQNPKKMRIYRDPVRHLALFYHYNCVERGFSLHSNENASPELGFDLCNDCAQENWIWSYYGRIVAPINIKKHVYNLGLAIKQPLLQGPHGFLFHELDQSLLTRMQEYEFPEAIILRKAYIAKKTEDRADL